jgi:hypothetical protein
MGAELMAKKNSAYQVTEQDLRKNSSLVPGKGWWLDTKAAADNCHGSYDNFCGKDAGHSCLLYGHHDHRGGLLFDGFSGWLIMRLTNFQKGIIMLKMDDRNDGDNWATYGWECENNECGDQTKDSNNVDQALDSAAEATHGRRMQECEFVFEFAIDGVVTSWTREQFEEKKQGIARVVNIWTLMDDPNYDASRSEAGEVEFAVRQRGCGRRSPFLLTHVYWA